MVYRHYTQMRETITVKHVSKNLISQTNEYKVLHLSGCNKMLQKHCQTRYKSKTLKQNPGELKILLSVPPFPRTLISATRLLGTHLIAKGVTLLLEQCLLLSPCSY